MKIKCTREALLFNINIALKAVAGKTTYEILECILLTADDGCFKMLANNLEIGIETAGIDAEILESGSTAVNAKLFSEIIRSLPDDDVSISADEKNHVIIKSGKSKFNISGSAADQFPRLSGIDKKNKYTFSALEFKSMIRQTIFSVSADESKPVFTGELLEAKGFDFNMVSTDGFRMSFRRTAMTEKPDDVKLIIPAKALSEISKILSDDENSKINIYYNENQALFEMDSCVMLSRLINGEFINYEQIFTNDYTTRIEIDRISFLRSLERAALISYGNKKTPVKIEVSQENKIIITSNTDINTSYEELNVYFEGKELTIGFNPRYLIDTLKAIEDEVISCQFMTELSPCIIKGVGNDDYKYLILPLKLRNDEF